MLLHSSLKNEFLGVANLALGIDNLVQEAAIQFGRNQGSRLRLISSSGNLIYSSKPDSIGNELRDEDFWAEIVKGTNEGSFTSKENGRQKIFSYYKSKAYRDFPSYNWIAVVSNDLEGFSEILLVIQSLRKIVLITTLVFIFLISTVAFLVSNSISRPLTELAEASKKLKNKRFNIRLKKKTLNDESEIGVLSRQFVNTNKELKNLYAGLESKIQIRTKALEQEKSKDEAILNSIGENLIVVDPKGKIILSNQSAQETLETSKLEGEKWPDILGKGKIFKENTKLKKSQLPLFIAIKQRRIIRSKALSYELPNGKKIDVSVTASPVVNKSKLEGAVLVFRDITIENEVEQMKDEFISLASHQLRTPLSAMRWTSEMLVNGELGKLTKQQKESIQDIYDSNQRMIQFVNRLLRMTRLEGGQIKSKPVPSNLIELFENSLKEMELKIKEKELRIISSFHKKAKLVTLDPELISEVIKNLLSNAIKYSANKSEIEIVISHKDNEFEIRVSDSGPGIPKHAHDQVFNKFFRTEDAYTIDPDGTGLGLYLSKKIIESEGGKIWFKTTENGTSFFFTLSDKK